MKTKLTLLIGTLFIATAVQAQVAGGIGAGREGWPRYTVKGEEFSIALPVPPSMTTRKVPLAGTNKNRVERVIQTTINNIDYTIYIYENPKPEQSLEDFIREQTANAPREGLSERTLTIDGRPGKEYTYQTNNNPVTEQFFAAEKRLYRFVASGVPAAHAGAEQFFASIAFGNKRKGFELTDGSAGEAPTAGGERLYTGREVDTKTRLISKPAPVYTAAARKNEITGVVILKVVFSADGKVTNIRVVQGLPHGMTEACIEAAKQIKFVPAMKDGKPVGMWMQLEYNLNLF
jgi:TonB family protein